MDDKQTLIKMEMLEVALRECHAHLTLHKESFKLTSTKDVLKIETYDMSLTIKNKKNLCDSKR